MKIKIKEIAATLAWLPPKFDPFIDWSYIYGWNPTDYSSMGKNADSLSVKDLCITSLAHRRRGNVSLAYNLANRAVSECEKLKEHDFSLNALASACSGLVRKDIGDFGSAVLLLRTAAHDAAVCDHSYDYVAADCWEQMGHIKFVVFCKLAVSNQYKEGDFSARTLLSNAAEGLKNGSEYGVDRSKHWYACSACNEGSIYYLKGEIDWALKLYLNSLRLLKEIGDTQKATIVLSNMSILYRSMGKSSFKDVMVKKSRLSPDEITQILEQIK